MMAGKWEERVLVLMKVEGQHINAVQFDDVL